MKSITVDGVKYKVLRLEVGHRGGGVEISLDHFKHGAKMAAYQNYLCGGMLSSIGVNDTLRQRGRPWLDEATAKRLDKVGERLIKAYARLVAPDATDEDIERLQARPLSAY
jgi:hypothetical protein